MRQRSAGLITEDRVKVYGMTIAVIQLLGLLFVVLRSVYFPGPDDVFSLGNDFRVFWAAARVALAGDPVDVYNPHKVFAVLQQIDPSLKQLAWHGWFYPPTFLLTILPFGLLSWWVAYAVFVGGSFAAYAAVLRKIAASHFYWWFVIGFPPVITTFILGQNSFLTAALVGVALMQLDRRPVLAGVCIGLLAFKPHLAILFPVALIVSGRWRVFGAATLTVTAFLGASVALFGTDAALLFLQGVRAARAAILEPYWPRLFMPTMYVGALNLGAGEVAANMLQAGATTCAAGIVAWVWRRDVTANVRNSALILATLLATPHLFAYDLTWLALPIVWMAIEGSRDEWLTGERGMLVFAWISPLVLLVPAALIGANPMPVVSIVLLAYVTYRARQQSQAAALATTSRLAA